MNHVLPHDIAERINDHHRRAQQSANWALQQAKAAGDLLLEVKAALPHGAWLPWLRANCEVGDRQAQRYIRLAKNWSALEAANASAPTYLPMSIDAALERLAKPRAEKPNDAANNPLDELALVEAIESTRAAIAANVDPRVFVDELAQKVGKKAAVRVLDEAIMTLREFAKHAPA